MAKFQNSGGFFNPPQTQTTGLIQPFGCALAVDGCEFTILAYSENCFDLLGFPNVSGPGLLGLHATDLFTPSSGSSLSEAFLAADLSSVNPIWVHSKSNRAPFYAILHRIVNVAIFIDLEPAPASVHAGALHSQNLAMGAISRLQSLPGGNIGALCDALVEDVQRLTGYNRVMVCKFREDGQGEVLSDIRRSDLESYLGFLYPARSNFEERRVRMIEDCNARPVRIIQSPKLEMPLCLDDSTLRASHGSHMAGMGSAASLTMGVVLSDGGSTKLWGLVVCHHMRPRRVPFPLRYACEFLMQAFSLHLELELQVAEKHKQTLIEACGGYSLWDTCTSTVVDIARFFENAVTPIFGVDSSGLINGWNGKMCELTGLDISEALGKSLIDDVLHGDQRERVRTLLAEALQGDEEKNLEVKLIKFGTQAVPNSFVYLLINACTSRDYQNNTVGVCFVGQDITAEKSAIDKLIRLEGDYNSIIQSVNPLIPPIFGSDMNACCSEWNAVMENLTGFSRHEVNGKFLPGEVFGSLCQLKGPVLLSKFTILLYQAIGGHDTDKLRFGFYNRKGKLVQMCLTSSKKVDEGGRVIGCLCFLETIAVDENKKFVIVDPCVSKFIKELAYTKQEMRNPLCGIHFLHKLLEGSSVTGNQKVFIKTSDACERQILAIIDNAGLEAGEMELKEEEFLMGSVVNAVVSQAMILLREKNLRAVCDIPRKIKTLSLYGDQIKLQSALSDFLICIVDHTPPDGCVEIKISPGVELVKDGQEFVRLEFKMAHPGPGLPHDLIEEMLCTTTSWTRQEGVALNIARKIVTMMNGNVCYVRDENKCYFRFDLELKSGKSG